MAAENIPGTMQDTSFMESMRAIVLKSIDEKKTKYRMLNKTTQKAQIVFVGSSLMEWFPIDEMRLTLNIDRVIYNRGIAGAATVDLLGAMEECIFDLEPSKIFINIGTNDIGANGPDGYRIEKLQANYNEIMDKIQKRLPTCTVFVMAYYPVNPKADFELPGHQKEEMFKTRTNENIKIANEVVEVLAKKHGMSFIDVNRGLFDEDGNLKKEYSIDGIHLWPTAYAVILENMKSYF